MDDIRIPSNHHEWIRIVCGGVKDVVLMVMGLSSISTTSSCAKTLLMPANPDSTILNKT
jgi:hypothetical protein